MSRSALSRPLTVKGPRKGELTIEPIKFPCCGWTHGPLFLQLNALTFVQSSGNVIALPSCCAIDCLMDGRSIVCSILCGVLYVLTAHMNEQMRLL